MLANIHTHLFLFIHQKCTTAKMGIDFVFYFVFPFFDVVFVVVVAAVVGYTKISRRMVLTVQFDMLQKISPEYVFFPRWFHFVFINSSFVSFR